MMHTTVSYTVFKTVRRTATIYYAEWAPDQDAPEAKEYRLYCGVAPYTYCAIVESEADRSDFEVSLRSASKLCASEGDALALACHDLTQPRDGAGRIKSVIEPRTGSEVIYATHNFCDRVTWFGDSARSTDEALRDDGDGLTFTGAHKHWIDMLSGRVLDDDGHVDEQCETTPDDPHGYQVKVYIDGVEATMREPFESTGGDYWVNWDAGKVVFFSSQAGKVVTASYSYEAGSSFYVRPLPGTVLNIESAAADFSSDIVQNDTIVYAVYGFADVFRPDLVANGTIPSGTKIELKRSYYKRYAQILTEAVGAYPTLAANASDPAHVTLPRDEFRRVSRGSRHDRQAVPFRYATVRDLHAAHGMELRVWLKHDREFGGEWATMTFYCTSTRA